MEELNLLMNSNTVEDDSNTLYVNRGYISIDGLSFVCKLRCTFDQVLKSFNGTEPLENDDGSLYWKVVYNDNVHVFWYVSRQRTHKQYFNYFSSVMPHKDQDDFLNKYIEECL